MFKHITCVDGMQHLINLDNVFSIHYVDEGSYPDSYVINFVNKERLQTYDISTILHTIQKTFPKRSSPSHKPQKVPHS